MNKVILSDGTIIKGFEMNGNVLVFQKDVDVSIFEGKIKPVIISTKDNESVYNDAVLITWEDNQKLISFREKTDLEIINEKCNSKIDYVAMMTDVDLPTM